MTAAPPHTPPSFRRAFAWELAGGYAASAMVIGWLWWVADIFALLLGCFLVPAAAVLGVLLVNLTVLRHRTWYLLANLIPTTTLTFLLPVGLAAVLTWLLGQNPSVYVLISWPLTAPAACLFWHACNH